GQDQNKVKRRGGNADHDAIKNVGQHTNPETGIRRCLCGGINNRLRIGYRLRGGRGRCRSGPERRTCRPQGSASPLTKLCIAGVLSTALGAKNIVGHNPDYNASRAQLQTELAAGAAFLKSSNVSSRPPKSGCKFMPTVKATSRESPGARASARRRSAIRQPTAS